MVLLDGKLTLYWASCYGHYSTLLVLCSVALALQYCILNIRLVIFNAKHHKAKPHNY